MKIIWEPHHNFNTKELRGCNFEVLPFIRLFPPGKKNYHRHGWTYHFGWLFWTMIIHSRRAV